MRFDPKQGFDAEFRQEIKDALPNPADANAVLEQLAQAVRWHLANLNRPRSVLVERDQLCRELKLIEHYAASLRAPRAVIDLGGTLEHRLRVLEDWKRDDEKLIKNYNWILRHSKGHDHPLELFYIAVLLIWRAAGGQLTISAAGTGPLDRFLTAVVFVVTGEMRTTAGLREIVWRFSGRLKRGRRPRKRREVAGR